MAKLLYSKKNYDKRKKGRSLQFRRKVMGSYGSMRRKWRISLRGNDKLL